VAVDFTVVVVVVVVMMLSVFFGTRMTNFNNRKIVIAKIIKTIKIMDMILAQR